MADVPSRPQTLIQRVTRIFAAARRVSFDDLALSDTVPTLTVQDRRTGESRDFPLLGEYYRLGRSSENDIPVASAIVSGQHLELSRDRHGGNFQLRDVGSTNGTFWRGRRIQGLELEDGDEISLGPTELETAPRLTYHHPPTPRQIWGRRLAIALASGGAGLALLVGLVGVSVSVRTLSTVQGPIAAYGSNGEPMQTARSGSHRELARLSDFSPNLVKALLASEDARFYWHVGLDPYGLLRAVLSNARGGREGASTLTQQIARTLYGDYVGGVEQATLGRKFREAVVALKLEAFHGKDELLRTYLNRVYLGVGYGFEDAAQAYFGKSARDLSLSEAALLVGLLPSPNGYSPCTNPEAALQQRNGVISRMADLGFISDAEARAARRSGVSIRAEECRQVSSILSPYYYDGMLAELTRLLGDDVVEEGNFAVETSLDPQMQRAAETQLRDFLRSSGPGLGVSQGAIVTLDSRNGDVLALVGGYDYAESQFNRATQSRRQPGSTFKLFSYAAALEQGIPPGQTWDCGPLAWMGQQFEPLHGCSGSLDLYRAMASSENTVALRLAREVGLETVVTTARRFGIGSDLQAVPGMVLGQNETTLLEMTAAYAAVADGGIWHRPRLIRRVFDTDRCPTPQEWQRCRTSYDQATVPSGDRRAVSADTAAVLVRLLQGAVSGGTGGAAALGRGEGGKTGTTNDGVDSWFIGFVPDRHLVTGIWLGNDDNRPTASQGAVAAGLWGRYMATIL